MRHLKRHLEMAMESRNGLEKSLVFEGVSAAAAMRRHLYR